VWKKRSLSNRKKVTAIQKPGFSTTPAIPAAFIPKKIGTMGGMKNKKLGSCKQSLRNPNSFNAPCRAFSKLEKPDRYYPSPCPLPKWEGGKSDLGVLAGCFATCNTPNPDFEKALMPHVSGVAIPGN
jgi:hypothetical protein